MTELMRRRAFLLLVLAAIAVAAISLRLADVQIFAAHRYAAFGRGEDTKVTSVPGVRGAILDRAGHTLALTEQRPDIIADPLQITDPEGEATVLSRLLSLPAATLVSDLRERSGYVDLARHVSESTATTIGRLGLAGITIGPGAERFHPAGQLASPVLGITNAAGNGASGLEYAFNQELAGRPGRLVQVVDPQGQPVPGGTIEDQPARLGDDLLLSLDEPLQYQTEQALGQALVASHGKSGMAIVMDTRTGGLLAVADLTVPAAGTRATPALPVGIGPGGKLLPPGTKTHSPQPAESASAAAFTRVYEPGSVEKLVTVSAALASGVVTPQQTFTIPNTYDVDGIPIHDAENHGTEQLSVTGIVAQSSNIGAVEIAQHLGATRLYRYLAAYGLGSTTPVQFPGESPGLVPPAGQVSPITLATMAYGEGISVTAAQMVSAYNTIANGGVYVPPHLVKALIGPHGREHPLKQPSPHRVVPASVARQMTAILEQVVSAGTGTNAAVTPYAVAGKTGTAQYLGPKGYLPGYTVASFAGFAPAQNPAVTVMVVVEDTPDFGAQAAAPAFSTITRDALQDLAVAPGGPQPPPEAAAQPRPAPAAGNLLPASTGTGTLSRSATDLPAVPAGTPAAGTATPAPARTGTSKVGGATSSRAATSTGSPGRSPPPGSG